MDCEKDMPTSWESLKGENLSYWADRAPTYSDVNREELEGDQRQRWTRELTAHLDAAFPGRDRSGVRVLDIGCGPGFFSIILAQAGYAVTAVDYTREMLKQARANAGDLADSIDFRRMDAESLELPDGYADVIVTRNLSWDLPHPDRAYAEWLRVLHPGGVLLNYDANWYRHLFDSDARDAYEADRRATTEAGVRDEYVGTDIDAMESIARRLPLGSLARPAWDMEVLRSMGPTFVEADDLAWERVFSDAERVNYASTPMFLVKAIK